MRKLFLITLLIVGVVLWWSYHDSPAAVAFKAFYEHVAQEHYGEATKLVKEGSPVIKNLEWIQGQAGIIPFPVKTRGISYQSVVCTKRSDGGVDIKAHLTRKVDPPGVTSAFGTKAIKYITEATLERSGDRWLVTSFSDGRE